MHWKLTGSLMLFLSVVHGQSATTSQPFDFIFGAMKACYDQKARIDVEFSKCVAEQLETHANPDVYRVKIIENTERSEPNAFKLLIYNEQGQHYTCEFEARNKIIFKACTGKQLKPLTPAEEQSIAYPSDG